MQIPRNPIFQILFLFSLGLNIGIPNSIAQNQSQLSLLPNPCPEYNYRQDSLIFDSLLSEFGQNKVLPVGFELPALRALSHFPELRTQKVEFRFVKSKTAHTSQPAFGSLFGARKNRKYLILVSTEVPDHFVPGMLKNLPYNAQIGVLGHELSHSVQYHEQGIFRLIGLGIAYSFSKRKVLKVEHATDSTAIAHNLGYQLLAWARIAHELLVADDRGDFYYKPEEIEKAMKRNPAY